MPAAAVWQNAEILAAKNIFVIIFMIGITSSKNLKFLLLPPAGRDVEIAVTGEHYIAQAVKTLGAVMN